MRCQPSARSTPYGAGKIQRSAAPLTSCLPLLQPLGPEDLRPTDIVRLNAPLRSGYPAGPHDKDHRGLHETSLLVTAHRYGRVTRHDNAVGQEDRTEP